MAVPALITDLQRAIHGWLLPWFDGAEHDLGGRVQWLPAAQIGFDELRAPPATGVGLHFVADGGQGSGRSWLDGEGAVRDEQPIGLLVLVRAAGDYEQGRSPQARARAAADALRLLVSTPVHVLPLLRAGLHGLRSTLPREVEDRDFHLCILRWTARLHRLAPTSAGPVEGVVPPPGETTAGLTELGAIVAAWWQGYFDGASHVVHGEAVAFPRAIVRAGRHVRPALVGAGAPSLELHWVPSFTQAPRQWGQPDSVRQHHAGRALLYLFSAQPEAARAKHEVRAAADLAYALVLDAALSIPLARWGITRLRADNPIPLEGEVGDCARLIALRFEWQTEVPNP